MRTLRGRWLHLCCGCGTREARPVRLMLRDEAALGGRTLADVIVHARCRLCGARPATMHLSENGHGPGPIAGGPAPGWSLKLHGPGV
jgi:hypothetical protein